MDTNVPRRRADNLQKNLFAYNEFYRQKKFNGSGSSAVVIASRGGNSIMRRPYALENFFSEKQENEQKYYENALSLLEIKFLMCQYLL